MIEKTISYRYKVYEQIKEDIITGVYSQGEVLNERKLSEKLGVSRTPIREAFQLLNVEGWLVYEPYKGTIVRTFSEDYVNNLLSVRKALEILAVEEAIKNITEDDMEVLVHLFEEHERSLNILNENESMKYDSKFHEKICQISNNKINQNLLNNLNDIIRFYGIKSLKVNIRKKYTILEHKAILQAIIERDIDEAREAMEHHIHMAGKSIIHSLSDKNNLKNQSM